jgi:acyl-CoA synthetase (AMP-forming)/AMP-acid ligase II
VLREGEGPFLNRYDELITAINKWQKIIQSNTTVENPKVGIIHELNFEYVALIYACINIGAEFIILDGIFNNNSKHNEFLPLDLVIGDHIIDQINSRAYWIEHNTPIVDFNSTYSESDNLVVSDLNKISNYFLLGAATSGTTGSPKKVEHTYDFMLDLAVRNADILKLSGRVAHIKNLHHGSSLPVFFLPSLITSNFHFYTPLPVLTETEEALKHLSYYFTKWIEYLDINHINVPYTDLVENILKSIDQHNAQFSNLTLYTLSYIRPEWAQLIKGKNIKIVSIFGCTETSGPVLINQLDNTNLDTFDNTIFFALDDFYQIELLPHGTKVNDCKNRVNFTMSDIFTKVGSNEYKHQGRSDICRINDIELNISTIHNVANLVGIDGQIVVDKNRQKLYLAVWDNSEVLQSAKKVDTKLAELYYNSGPVKLSLAKHLDKNKYLSGIKVDMEKLRREFRNYE